MRLSQGLPLDMELLKIFLKFFKLLDMKNAPEVQFFLKKKIVRKTPQR